MEAVASIVMALSPKLSSVVLPVVVVACTVSNHDSYNAKAVTSVKQRAAFDFSCPENQIRTIEVVKDSRGFVTNLGAEGCGKKGIYVDPANNDVWILNGATQTVENPSATQPEALK